MPFDLPSHRQKAIDDYLALVAQYPELFPPRTGRPLVLDRSELTAYAARTLAEQGDGAAVIGLAARTPWHLFVVDLVRVGESELTTYDRLVPASVLYHRTGVAVVATSSDDLGRRSLVMVRIERHATGQLHWEIPRGYADPGLPPEELATKELAEEAGYKGNIVSRLGKVHTNTGQTEERVVFVHIETTVSVDAQPDQGESIREVRFWPIDEVWNAVRRGEITDSFTIQGLAFLEHVG